MLRSLAVLSRGIPAALAVAAVGCAQIVGIEDTVRAGDSVAVTRMSVGSQVVSAPLDPTGLMATYFVASSDPSGFDRVMATPDPARGRWITKLRTPAPVEFTLPDVPTPTPRLFALPSSELKVLSAVLEHPAPQPAPMGATFTVNATLDAPVAAGQTFQAYVVGAWLQRGFAAAELPVAPAVQLAPTFAFTAASSVAGRAQIDQVTTDDAFLILRYTGTALTGVAEAPAFAQTGMATTVPAATMTAVAQDQQLDVKIAPPVIAGRYAKVAPAVATLQMTWSLVAAPGAAIAATAGPALDLDKARQPSALTAGPALQSGDLQMADIGISVSYGNPFATTRGWSTIFTLATAESRAYSPPLGPMGMPTPITLFAGMNQFFDPAHATDLELPAGLPQAITIGGVLLAPDGLTIRQPTRFVDVSFTVDTPMLAGGPAPGPELYELDVFELTVNAAGTALDRHLVLAAVSDAPTFALPPELFPAGHTFSLRAWAYLGGFPALDQGNLVDRQLPHAQGYLDGGVFTVVP